MAVRPLPPLAALLAAALALGAATPALADPTHDPHDAVLPVVSYTFDGDTGSTVLDDSGHGNNGTWSGTPAYAAGVSGRALHISAGKNFVTLPKAAGQTDGTGSFSFQTWWYDNAATADAPLVSNQDFNSCANAGFSLYHLSGTYQQRSCFAVGGTKTYSPTRTASIQNGWHHLAVVQDAAAHTYAYYVDGVLASSTATGSGTNAANFASGSPIRIGQDGAGAYSATEDALVDDFTFYNQAITADQIAADYAATNPATHLPAAVTVHFDGNGATGGSTADQQLTYGQGAALNANGFTKDGSGFLGWATSPAGRVEYGAGQQVTDLPATDGGKVTLYAVWGKVRAAGDTAAPIVSYDFEADQNGVVSDGSGQGADGSWHGTATYAKGFAGKAAHVSSGSNFVRLPLSAGRTDGSGSFSFSTWWGEYAETSDTALVSNQDSNSCFNAGMSLYHLSGTSTTRACWGQPTGTTRQYSATSATALQGSWHYLTVVVDRGAQTLSYYVDGKPVTTSAAGQLTSATKLLSGLPFTIGQDGTGAYAASVDALVDQFDFYDQPLTASQVANDYNATKPAATVLPDESTVDIQPPVSTLPAGFVTDTFHARQTRVGTAITQPLAALWHGAAVTSYTRTGGDDWLSVDAQGVVHGTAPASAPQHPGTVTVQATDGSTTGSITVEVPVLAAGEAPQLATTTWNLWDAGSHVDDALLKDLAVIGGNGFDVIGVQEDGGTVAHQLAQALGWYDREGPGGVGILSAWPISADGVVTAGPALGVTVSVAGRDLRVWTAALDEGGYGPDAACAEPGADPAAVTAAERATTRYAQAQALAAALRPEAAAAGRTPLVLLGSLASPSAADWTAATAAAHCGTGAVDWPATGALTAAGLTDSFRAANPDPADNPGTTWSPIATTGPHDRIDYVDYAGADLRVLGSNTLVAGWPSAENVNANAWTSDHTAVVTTFSLGTPQPPVVSTAITPGAPDGRSGWYVTAPVVTASATDGSALAPALEYRTGGGSWAPYPGPVTAAEGARSYEFRATGHTGLTGDPVAVPVRYDGTAPSTTASTTPGATSTAPVTVTLTAGDTGSGVAGTEYRLGEGGWTPYAGPFTVAPLFADQTLSYRSTDIAGTTEPDRRLVIPAIKPVAPAISTTATAPRYGTAATVTVTVSSPGLPATGTITLTEGTTPRGTARLADGTATFTLPPGLAAGGHVLLAAYAGSELLTPAGQTLLLTVGLPPAWSATATYRAGDQVSYRGAAYTASWTTKAQQPGDPQGPWQEYALTEDGTAAWTASHVFEGGELAVYQGRIYRAGWHTRNQTPGSPTGPWEEQAPAGPDGLAPWTATTVYLAGAEVSWQGGTYQARWYTRNQTPGTPSGPWRKLP
ncbi:hypothetical protein CFP65_6541 [Kitasatospora sp. MMS16-BH015]|uniref:OmpL47-type beta-barrel domain-containing protein n=1 Tax=Kitasatospora sp. MMS16-BH015 TaxID=2018025 RepID=UPI000CA36509|nr:carbohydrate-binding protein [Kitasatospora sp. MMS16-BH015]AUG81191.1 hypothetical protein CFP65_6541 [Kitasatospora sp. MMS16-BH015]